MRKGWFKIDGVQEGDRTIDEQILGVEPALAACAGKTVLDFGAAEGLIAKAFLDRGASAVLGVDNNAEFIQCAEQLGLDPHRVRFLVRNLNDMEAELYEYQPADIVLALAIVHKLREPASALSMFAGLAQERLVLRLPFGSKGVIRYKHDRSKSCDAYKVMQKVGFRLEGVLPGPRGELVQHWIRS